MSLIVILAVFVVTGVVLYAINRWVPMDPGVRQFMNIAVVIALALWFLRAIGVLGWLASVRV